jgi:hypothetical protein
MLQMLNGAARTGMFLNLVPTSDSKQGTRARKTFVCSLQPWLPETMALLAS